MNKITIFVFVLSVWHAGVFADNETKCPAVPKHYAELDCKPVVEPGNECPSRYECPEITDLDGKKCYYQGKAYARAANLPSEETEPLCAAACRCNDKSDPASFVCANIECPHHFQPYRPECKQIYDSDSCCPSKTVCDKAEIENLSTCYLDGKMYRAGENMYPSNEGCYKCRCADNFDNSTITDNPNCKVINCGIQLRNFNRVRKGCIPLYYGNSRCCPIGWRCPNDQEDTIVSVSRIESPDPKMKCNFGGLTMNIGDVLKTNHKCQTCSCIIPPMPTCIQTPDC